MTATPPQVTRTTSTVGDARSFARTRALDIRERVRASLNGPDLLTTATEDCCTWYGYLSVVLCHIPNDDEVRAEDHPAGR